MPKLTPEDQETQRRLLQQTTGIDVNVHLSTWLGGDQTIETAARAFADHVVDPRRTITLELDYPLTGKHTFTLDAPTSDTFTLKELIDGIARTYQKVYEDEGPPPPRAGALLNRPRTNGPYGIWGHDLDDLYLEGVCRGTDGIWRTNMGS